MVFVQTYKAEEIFPSVQTVHRVEITRTLNSKGRFVGGVGGSRFNIETVIKSG